MLNKIMENNMREIKKSIAAVITAAMVVTTIGTVGVSTVSAASATKVKVTSGSKVQLEVGNASKVIVKANGKVTYKSSSKKVVKVSKKGMLKAVAPGKATITVKGASKKVKVNVTVKPKKVTLSKVTKVNETSAKVSWKSQKNVTGYMIYISENGGKYKLSKTIKGAKKSSSVVNGLTAGSSYTFKVRAYKFAGKNILGVMSSASASIKTYRLVWSDEFDGKTLDTNIWKYYKAPGYGSSELCEYTEGDNLEVKDGNLVFMPRVYYDTKTKMFSDASATSISTKETKEFKYGKMEVRVKAAKAKGTWSLGYMVGNDNENVGWPQCGEIDFMEAKNGAVVQAVNRPWLGGDVSKIRKAYTAKLTQESAAADYHTYTVIWNEDTVQFSVDGVITGTYKAAEETGSRWVFDHEFFMNLGCIVSPQAGELDASEWNVVKTEGDIQTLEDRMYVDYVRVYQ